MTKLIASLSLLLLLSSCNYLKNISTDIVEWRGPNRTGVYQEPNLLTEWPEKEPDTLWTINGIPDGYASMSIVDDVIYTTGKNDSIDICVAIDMDGNLIWQTEYGRAWNGSFPASRCTPTFNDGKLYLSSGYGDIACLNATTGDIIWKVQGYEKFNINFNIWGCAESLIVLEDKVMFNPIGSKTTTVALNKETGGVIWESESIGDSMAYVSPILINHEDKNIIVNVSSNFVYGVNIANGEVLWTFKYYDVHTPLWHPNAPIINCNTPLYYNGRLYITSGYNHTAIMLKLIDEGKKAEMIWADTTLDTHHGGVVKVGNYIYGSNWINNGTGNWCCINWETGEVMWETEWHCKGSIIANNDILYLYDEKKGNIGLVQASSDSLQVINSFQVTYGNGPHWSHPVIYDGKLFIRHGKTLIAYDI